ncbi:hypothetical protein BUE68_12735, partial [Corynebacterium diphtheriae]
MVTIFKSRKSLKPTAIIYVPSTALLTLGLMITLVMGILPLQYYSWWHFSHGDNIQISQVPEANRHHLRTFNCFAYTRLDD